MSTLTSPVDPYALDSFTIPKGGYLIVSSAVGHGLREVAIEALHVLQMKVNDFQFYKGFLTHTEQSKFDFKRAEFELRGYLFHLLRLPADKTIHEVNINIEKTTMYLRVHVASGPGYPSIHSYTLRPRKA